MASPRTIHIDEEQDIVCAVCGVTILDSGELHQQPSCQHVRFVYCNGECFEYVEPELEAVLVAEEAAADEQGEFFDMWDALRRHCKPSDLILEHTDRSMACGPVSFTVWVGLEQTKRSK